MGWKIKEEKSREDELIAKEGNSRTDTARQSQKIKWQRFLVQENGGIITSIPFYSAPLIEKKCSKTLWKKIQIKQQPLLRFKIWSRLKKNAVGSIFPMPAASDVLSIDLWKNSKEKKDVVSVALFLFALKEKEKQLRRGENSQNWSFSAEAKKIFGR